MKNKDTLAVVNALQSRLSEAKQIVGGSEDGTDSIAVNLNSVQANIASVLGADVPVAGVEAGTYATKAIQLHGKMQSSPMDVEMVSTIGAGKANTIVAGNEAFVDFDKGMSIAVAVTIQSSIASSSIDPVLDAFFPVYLIDPEKFGYVISVEVAQFVNPKINPLTGSANKGKSTSLIKELATSDKFKVAANRIYPVVRPSTEQYIYNPAGANLAENVTTGKNEDVVTAPIKLGTTVPFLEVGQTNQSAARELTDYSDTLTDSVTINELYFTLTGDNSDGDSVTENYKVPLPKNMARFSPSNSNGAETNDFTLLYDVEGIKIPANKVMTTSNVETAISDLQDLPAGSYISIDVTLAGKVNIGDGFGSVSVAQVGINGLYGSNDVRLTTDAADKVVAVLESNVFKAFMPEMYATNENMRTRSIQLANGHVKYGFGVTPKQLCSEVVPVSEEKQLLTKSFATELFIKRSMVSAGMSVLKALPAEISSLVPGSPSHGVFNSYFTPTVITDTVNLSDEVKTLRTAGSVDDIRQALEYRITEIAIELGRKSNYKKAYSMFRTGKPTVIVGTTDSIARYLVDFEAAGYSFVIRSTVEEDMFGDEILIGFGDVDVKPTTVPTLTQFGRCAYLPGYTSIRNNTGNTNTVSSETMAIYDFHVHAKIIGKLTVNNLSTFTRVL